MSEQLFLTKPPTAENPGRPRRYAREFVRAAAEALAPDVAEWADDSDHQKIALDLFEAMTSIIGFDGFDIAKRLADNGWEPDAELVEILEQAESEIDSAYRKGVSQWIKLYNITPLFKIGDVVAFNGRDASRSAADGEIVTGTICKVDAEQGSYTVNIPAFGHQPYITNEEMKAGKKFQNGVPYGQILNFEILFPGCKGCNQKLDEASQDGLCDVCRRHFQGPPMIAPGVEAQANLKALLDAADVDGAIPRQKDFNPNGGSTRA